MTCTAGSSESPGRRRQGFGELLAPSDLLLNRGRTLGQPLAREREESILQGLAPGCLFQLGCRPFSNKLAVRDESDTVAESLRLGHIMRSQDDGCTTALA